MLVMCVLIVKHFVCTFHMCVNPQTEAIHFWKINKNK